MIFRLPFPQATSVAERMANSVAVLDVITPNWRDMIDTNTLNLNDADNCILGQIGKRAFGGLEYSDMFFNMRFRLLGNVTISEVASSSRFHFAYGSSKGPWLTALAEKKDDLAALREAVEALRAKGYTVEVTTQAPAPAKITL